MTAARRAFSLSSCITQRNAVYRRSPLPAVESLRHDWSEVAGHQVTSRGRPGLVRPDSGVAAVRSAGSSSTTKGWQCGPGFQPPAWVRVTYRPRLRKQATAFGVSCPSTRQYTGIPASACMTGLTARSFAIVDAETTSTIARTAAQGSLVAISPTAPAATTPTPGTSSFPPGRATLTAPGTSASAPTVIAAWVRVRCSHSIAITGMFNAHHARARLSCIQNQSVRLSASCRCPERRSDDGHTILECTRTGLKSCPDLVLLVELSGLEPLTSCMP
jgi:hypothetical protein